uniref:7TM_GPCR_Srx domain-containing protein n=1 Tax=Heterorhabditis bacteriophora TaxID=37862 RepID=A0A1I7WRP7_HETBA
MTLWPTEWELDHEFLINAGGRLQKLKMFPYFDISHYFLVSYAISFYLGDSNIFFRINICGFAMNFLVTYLIVMRSIGYEVVYFRHVRHFAAMDATREEASVGRKKQEDELMNEKRRRRIEKKNKYTHADQGSIGLAIKEVGARLRLVKRNVAGGITAGSGDFT